MVSDEVVYDVVHDLSSKESKNVMTLATLGEDNSTQCENVLEDLMSESVGHLQATLHHNGDPLPREHLKLPEDIKPELALAWFTKRTKLMREDGQRRERQEYSHLDGVYKHFGSRSVLHREARVHRIARVNFDSILKNVNPDDTVDLSDSTEDIKGTEGDNDERVSNRSQNLVVKTTIGLPTVNKIHPTWKASETKEPHLTDDDAATDVSGMSKAQSEKTQITSNLVFDSYPNSLRSLNHRTSIGISSLLCNDTKSSTGSSTDDENCLEDAIEIHPETVIIGTVTFEAANCHRVSPNSTLVDNINLEADIVKEIDKVEEDNLTKFCLTYEKKHRNFFLWTFVVLIAVFVIIIVSATLATSNRDNTSTIPSHVDDDDHANKSALQLFPTSSPTALSPTPFGIRSQLSLHPSTVDNNQYINNLREKDTEGPTLNSEAPKSKNIISVSSSSLEVIADGHSGDLLGSSLALSHSGNVMVVGAPGANSNNTRRAGKVEIYERYGNVWKQRRPINIFFGENRNGAYGTAVTLSSDGAVVAVSEPTHSASGANGFGSVRIYQYDPGNRGYSLFGNTLSGDGKISKFGSSLQLSSSGRHVVIGAPFAGIEHQGTVYVYEFNPRNNTWILLGTPLHGSRPNDSLGTTVAILEASNEKVLYLAASAPNNNTFDGYVNVWKFTYDNNRQWERIGSEIRNPARLKKGNERATGIFGSSLSLIKREGPVTEKYHQGHKNFQHLFITIGCSFRYDNGEGKKHAGMAVTYELFPLLKMKRNSLTRFDWVVMGDIIKVEENSGDQISYSVQLIQLSIIGKSYLILAIGDPGANQRTGCVRWYQYENHTQTWNLVDGTNALFSGSKKEEAFGTAISLTQASSDGVIMMAVGAKHVTSYVGKGYVALFTIKVG